MIFKIPWKQGGPFINQSIWSYLWALFFQINHLFWKSFILSLQKSCKANTELSYTLCQFTLALTSYISRVHLSQALDQYSYYIIN